MTGGASPPNVAQAVLEWSRDLPMWQRDALRRIMTTAELSQVDEDEVYALAKAENGLGSPGGSLVPVPLTVDHVPAGTDEGAPVTLLAVHDVAHVNALASEQKLAFAPEGLTVVYGENATGKSGYSRVLKRACRARDSEEILPNVMEESTGVAEAQFDLLVGEENVTVTWQDNSVPPDVLSAIAIFDSATARVFVDSENEVRFLPYGLDAFSRLGGLCGDIKERLLVELGSLKPGSDALTFGGDTEAARLVAALDSDCCPVDAAVLACLSPEELKEIDELRAAKLQDPAERAKTLRFLATRVRGLAARTKALAQSVSSEALVELKRLSANAKVSSDAAKLASESEFENEPLPGIGSESWRQMFEAARRFSETEAYPSAKFPVIEAGSRCVLCLQPLAESAAERMRRFEDFVADETAKRAVNDDKALQDAVKLLKEVDAKPQETDPTLLDELREHDSVLGESFVPGLNALRAARDQCIIAVASGDWDDVRAPAAPFVKSLASLAEAIEKDAVEVERSADPEEQARISTRLAELEARKTLGDWIPQVADSIGRKRVERDLGQCMKSADTNAITRKGGELHRAAVTEALQSRLQDELAAVGVTHIALEVADRGSAGKRLHRMTMPGAAKSVGGLSRVLSEGEHRAVAIAAMLAECGLQGDGFPIILDDPVCSLDHRYRERVAARLVKESEHRQVIVLTHDVFFLTELQMQAFSRGLNVEMRSVRRIGSATGVCDGDQPWRTMTVEQRLQWCDEELARLKKVLADEGDSEAYVARVGYVVDRLRSTWERAIEDKIFNRVVTRFQNSVKVERLESVVFSDDDFAAVMAARDRLSAMTPAHDEAAEAIKPLPAPDDLKTEVVTLRDFVAELRSRQKAAVKARVASK